MPPVSTPSRDPCNFPDTYKPRHEPVNLWPQLQTKGMASGSLALIRTLLMAAVASLILLAFSWLLQLHDRYCLSLGLSDEARDASATAMAS